jgi:hypothetical protein
MAFLERRCNFRLALMYFKSFLSPPYIPLGNYIPLGIVAQVHDQMETGMEDNTIQLGKRLLIQD